MFPTFLFQNRPSWTINSSLPLVQGINFVPHHFVRSSGSKFNLQIIKTPAPVSSFIFAYIDYIV